MSWESWNAATCWPASCFCEGVRDGLLRQPANAWSSLGFCVAGGLMLRELAAHPRSRIQVVESWCLALAVTFVGATSAFFHASLSLVGQWLDLQSMYLLALVGFALNLDALRPGGRRHFLAVYIAFNLLFACILVWAPVTRRIAFGVALLLVVATEILLQRRKLRSWPLSWLVAAGGVQAFAFGIWWLDLKHIVCVPESLWQGHAAWHLLGAIASYLLWRYYRGPASVNVR